MSKTASLHDLINRWQKLVIGLNSGTSADGIDAAIIRVTGSGLRSKIDFIGGKTFKFSSAMKRKILHGSAAEFNNARAWLELDIELAEKFAAAAMKIARLAGLKLSEIALIGSHGQTVRHLPRPGSRTITLQLADPARIAVKTGVTTVGDFRIADAAAGGEGAPLTPVANAILFGRKSKMMGILNIGGIANISRLAPFRDNFKIFGCDTGPGNMLLDHLSLKLFKKDIDRGGGLADRGVAHEGIISHFLKDPFYAKKGPKSTGREKFGGRFGDKFIETGRKYGLGKYDILATATKFVAKTVIRCCEVNRLKFDELIVAGGGSLNRHLVGLLKGALPVTRISSPDDYGYPASYLEAISFAILANEAICSNRYYLRTVTGSPKAVVLGKICQG